MIASETLFHAQNPHESLFYALFEIKSLYPNAVTPYLCSKKMPEHSS